MKNLASNISIHSFNSIFADNQKKLVNFFWILILLCSFSGFCFYFYSAFVKWQKTPDVVMDLREKNSKDFPFPAITICSPLFARDNLSNFYNFIHNFEISKHNNLSKPSKSECEFFGVNINWCF